VVNRRFYQRIFPRSQPPRTSHAPKLAETFPMPSTFLIVCLSPSHV
jgi:hypothetical protein